GRPRCTAATAARRRRSPRDRATCPLALPDLALQREGALGTRLEGHPARAPRARDELRAAGAVGDRAGEAAHPVSVVGGSRYTRNNTPRARTPVARATASAYSPTWRWYSSSRPAISTSVLKSTTVHPSPSSRNAASTTPSTSTPLS